MARKDLFHEEFKQALTKDGWKITHDPLIIRLTEERLGEIDLGAEKVIGASKEGTQIAVEVKTFLAPSFVNSLHRAVGQYINYSIALRRSSEARTLYLAIPDAIWIREFQDAYLKEVLSYSQIKLITYDPATKEIVRWIE